MSFVAAACAALWTAGVASGSAAGGVEICAAFGFAAGRFGVIIAAAPSGAAPRAYEDGDVEGWGRHVTTMLIATPAAMPSAAAWRRARRGFCVVIVCCCTHAVAGAVAGWGTTAAACAAVGCGAGPGGRAGGSAGRLRFACAASEAVP